ncbi:hypothetical protein TNIN_130521 [Trichonephila inaurata madagascariensis]|uniref:Uncharacterized protein n=1 Tax=Trichonephila inaurata madagascariensis TaxID=2747483 RepID=A0A8X6I524_9ARAC|nr:hypothetical protein TNIN_130521 [Trichonephila inaurata madagascariensis]
MLLMYAECVDLSYLASEDSNAFPVSTPDRITVTRKGERDVRDGGSKQTEVNREAFQCPMKEFGAKTSDAYGP